MEELKIKQREIYDSHIVKSDPHKINLDRRGFIFIFRLKERKLKKLLTLLRIFPKAVVLDIGCRDGRFLNKLNAQYKTQGIGIDISSLQLRENLINNPFNNIYSVSDAEIIPFKDNSFDFVFCFDVFEHLSHPARCIAEISRVLKPKSQVLVYTINQNDKYTWHYFLRKISLGKLGVDRGDCGDHDKDRFLRIEETVNDYKESGLKIDKIIFFHAFFTLAFDEICQKFLNFVYMDTKQSNLENKRVVAIMKIFSYLLDSLLSVLEFIDRLWTDRGYSNGFFIVVHKEEKNYAKINF
jgi:ubiquinone/menaquinone biosynthesis C-methylase UbiE